MVSALFLLERDLIAAFGLLTHNYLHFDAPLSRGGVTTHIGGYNVHCLIVDNSDGEVLAVGRNKIFEDEDPLQHAEQVVLRAALRRLKAKVPRELGVTVDKYYKTKLFMAPGLEVEDMALKGCTLYNTFDPCGFCAVTLLIAYMKRIAYLFDDDKFAAVYDYMKQNYFAGRDSRKGPVVTACDEAPAGSWHMQAGQYLEKLRSKLKTLKDQGIPLVMALDSCWSELQEAASLFAELEPTLLLTHDGERSRNERTLADLRRLCGGI